jgi:hypothetical protein
MDGVIKKQKNNKFETNEYGGPAYPNRPKFDPEYYKLIIKDTGDKLKVKPVEQK